MAERGRKELVYKGNRLHIFPLVSEQGPWSQHKAGPKQRKKGDRRGGLPGMSPQIRNGETGPVGSVCFYSSGGVRKVEKGKRWEGQKPLRLGPRVVRI